MPGGEESLKSDVFVISAKLVSAIACMITLADSVNSKIVPGVFLVVSRVSVNHQIGFSHFRRILFSTRSSALSTFHIAVILSEVW